MLTPSEFEALLDRYLAGQSLPEEQLLVEQWSQQLGLPEPPPLEEQTRDEVRRAIWQRIVAQTKA